jgi:DNA topoisomerase-1
MSAAIKQVATALGNTPSVCRKSYIHPAITSAYLGGGFVVEAVRVTGSAEPTGLRTEEAAVLSLLRSS